MNRSEELWRRALLPFNTTIGGAIQNLNETAVKIVMVVNECGVLQGTISDGDIRRGLLRGLDLTSPIASIMHRNPLVAPPMLSRDLVMQLMASNKVQQIPVVDDGYHIIGLHLWDEIISLSSRSNLMIIMAGGAGKRLRPYTEACPKPLLPIAGKPMLEHIIMHAKAEGFINFVISTHYLGYKIEEYFGDGHKLGVEIGYLRENSPLGTAGALSLLDKRSGDPFVVTNGDVITDIHYGDLLDFHIRSSAVATMAVRLHEWQNPFGVVQTKGIDIVSFEEKPIVKSHINAGVYALNAEALNVLEANTYCDMPTLFERLQEKSKRTVAYPMHEPWLDVGNPEDFQRANQESDI